MSRLVLYSAAGVPSPRRVVMCLLEKRLPFTVKWLNLALMDQKSPDYLKLNPTGLVPTLIHGTRALFDSNVINEYLDCAFPEPRLVPPDPWGQAQMRAWFAFENDWAKPFRDAVYETMAKERIRSSGLTAEQAQSEIARRTPNAVYGRIAARLITEPTDETILRDRLDILAEKIAQMEDMLADGRPWLCGDTFTLADICLVPRLEMFPVLGVSDLYTRHPRIGRFVAAVKMRPSWERSGFRPESGETERLVEP